MALRKNLRDCCIIDNGDIVQDHNVIADGCDFIPCISRRACMIGLKTAIGVGDKITNRAKIGSNVILMSGTILVVVVSGQVIVEDSPEKNYCKNKI